MTDWPRAGGKAVSKIDCDGFTLEVVKVKGGWAQKATMDGKSRFRFYHYKKEAELGLAEWVAYQPKMFFEREFYHNFHDEAGE